jgi:ureidoacrylate peracid hydrolase
MSLETLDPATSCLVLVDLQNDFVHPDGAYARGGVGSEGIAALPDRLAPLADAFRAAGGAVMSTHFTLVHGVDGEPFISPHLKKLRPFLRRGDFAAGSWGHDLVDELKPAHFRIEKVAFSAFYMSRMEFVLRRAGLETLVFAGIVTNGGVASTVRDAHVRDFHPIVLSDGCGAMSKEVHETAIAALAPVAAIHTVAEALEAVEGARGATG